MKGPKGVKGRDGLRITGVRSMSKNFEKFLAYFVDKGAQRCYNYSIISNDYDKPKTERKIKMEEKVRIGDTIEYQGLSFVVSKVIRQICYAGLWDVEFEDPEGNYHRWYQQIMGGSLIPAEPVYEDDTTTYVVYCDNGEEYGRYGYEPEAEYHASCIGGYVEEL